ncbi:hypothetical protein COO91_08093 [Nostoc flagelliforme CCNUN1]|uniref:Uncharacterized protein n=1 Tax=Nostoc flagelliforme CCNUN1 TaxID=2038116 RepID=A0A2K8T4Q8_9NOSO|nr:hypothetical protein COO91_08093 [Nostoc flagelliforme CCNUN1]
MYISRTPDFGSITYTGTIEIIFAVSLSLPSCWKGKHCPVFAHTPELLRWWKSSSKDASAQKQYKRQFKEILSLPLCLFPQAHFWVGRPLGELPVQ